MERPQPSDRRLVTRYHLPPVSVGWRLRRVDTPAGQVVLPGTGGWLLDISVTGARIEALHSPDLHVGFPLTVEIMDVSGPVVIRRIGPSPTSDRRIYGLEFADPTSALTTLVHHELLSSFVSTTPDQWHDARYVP